MKQQVKSFIESHDNFLVAGHINADGDAISSALMIAHLLTHLGKNYRLIFHDELVDQRFTFLEKFDEIANTQNVDFVAESAIICDTPTTERVGLAANFFPKKDHILKIDHHPSEEDFGFINWVDTASSSTTSIAYEILNEFDMPYTKQLAQIVLTGLMYDTGRFSYSNTTAFDLEIASKMIQFGADAQLSYMKIFCENSLSAIKTIGKGLENMETFFNDQLGIIHLTHEETIKNPSGEIEELAAHTTDVSGSHVGLFIREPEKGLFKVSLRSRGLVNVNEVASHFGGGGHIKASGCRIHSESYEDVKTQLLDVVETHLKKHQYL